jgi:4'-phosphopantetheinyl transferase EntD
MLEMPSPEGPRMLLLRCPLAKRQSRFTEDLGRASEKRIIDHSSGRWLLEQALIRWGIADISQIEVRRDENRAPYLSWIPGCWRNEPLPSISIAHCQSAAVVALIESSYWLGIDAELVNRGIAENAFDMMAKGGELARLKENPRLAIEMWTAKEAIQKAHHLGMNLNPRDIKIDKPEIELYRFIDGDLQIALAWRNAGALPRSAEDDLLDATRKALESGQDFTVGCQR